LNEGVELKAETSLVLDENLKAVAYGLKGKKDVYMKNRKGHLFQWFLYQAKDIIKDDDENVMASDYAGKKVPLIHVFSEALSYIAKSAIEKVKGFLTCPIIEDIYWVILIPLIITPVYSGFLRRAAVKAEMIPTLLSHRLKLVQLPEAALADLEYFHDISPGHEVMILNCEEDAVHDMAFVKFFRQPVRCQYLKTSCSWSGGFYTIDKSVYRLLEMIFGIERYEKMKELPAHRDMMEGWEQFKIAFDGEHDYYSLGLGLLIEDYQEKYFLDVLNREVLEQLINQYNNSHPLPERIERKRESLLIPNSLIKIWFDSVIDEIIRNVEEELSNKKNKGIQILYLIGMFCGNRYFIGKITNLITEKLVSRRIQIIASVSPEFAALRGAVAILRGLLADEIYLREAINQGKKEWGRSKIMIVGEGRAGKTALANSILGKSYENLNSTVGINEFTCSIGYASVGNAKSKEVNFWKELKDQKKSKELENAVARLIFLQKTGKPLGSGSYLEIDMDKATLKARCGYVELDQNDINSSTQKETNPSVSNELTTSAIRNSPDNPKDLGNNKEAKPEIGSENAGREKNRDNYGPKVTEGVIMERSYHSGSQPLLSSASYPEEEIDNELVMKCLGEQFLLESKFIVSVFDFGGQSVFNVIHPFFLTRFGVYIITFNMEWLSSGTEQIVKEDCIRYLFCWLNSVIVHTQNEEGEMATILFVGTRKDLITKPAEHQAISTFLYNTFSSSLAWPFVLENIGAEGCNGKADLFFFPVNNKLANDDPIVQKLLQIVENVIDHSNYVHVKRPLNWFRVLDLFKSMNVPYLTFSEVELMIDSCHIPQDHIPTLLRFFHEMGVLMWHDEDTLRDIIVFDPIEYFVKPSTIIICKHVPDKTDGIYHSMEIHRKMKKLFVKEFHQMTSHGIVSEILLIALLEEYTDYYKYIKQLMIKYGLLVPLILSQSEEEEEFLYFSHDSNVNNRSVLYLAPALLPEIRIPLSLTSSSSSDISNFFAFIFTSTINDLAQMSAITLDDCRKLGFLPSGLFEKLIGKAIAWSMSTSDYVSRGTLYNWYKNSVELAFGNQLFQMTVDYDYNFIYVELIKGNHPMSIHDRLKDEIQEVIFECFKSLRFLSVLTFPTSTSSVPVNNPNLDFFFIPLPQIRKLVDKEKSPMSMAIPGRRNLISYMDAVQWYKPWLTDFLSYEEYDVFISYRWGLYDSKFTSALFDRLSLHSVDLTMRPIQVFLDNKRLPVGDHFQMQFILALSKSIIFLPIVSSEALQRMLNLKPTDEDNVLLEWICGLELMKQQQFKSRQERDQTTSSPSTTSIRLMKFMPIFFGSRQPNDENSIQDLFRENFIAQLPEISPTAILNIAKRLLLEILGIVISKEMQTATVKEIVSQVSKYLSLKSWEMKNIHQVIIQASKKIIPNLNECLQLQHQLQLEVQQTEKKKLDIPVVAHDSMNNHNPTKTAFTNIKSSLNELKELLKKEFGISSNNAQEVIQEALGH
jgi:GTPase SAR1 family protein